jgi:D-alanyl-D-alanine carboxypeptidase
VNGEKMRIQNKKRFFITIGSLLLFFVVVGVITVNILSMIAPSKSKVENTVQNNSNSVQTTTTQPTVSQNNVQSNSSQSNISSNQKSDSQDEDVLILVNKQNSIDKNYVPSDLETVDLRGVRETRLRAVAAENLVNLFSDGDAKGITLYCCSGYRSYETQKELYEENVKTYGQKEADLVSAKPGMSEHQTGLAMDVTAESVNYDLTESFGETKEGQYIRDNAYKYGFIIRYPADKTAITGYAYEPWHLRYVGVDAATVIHEKDITFEEYLNN